MIETFTRIQWRTDGGAEGACRQGGTPGGSIWADEKKEKKTEKSKKEKKKDTLTIIIAYYPSY